MTAQARASESFRRLIDDGRRVVAAGGWDGDNYQRFPAADDYFRFRTEAMNLVRRTCGPDSDHYRELKRLAEAKESATNPFYLVHCLGVLEAAQRDFDGGLLFDLRALIAADVLEISSNRRSTFWHPATTSPQRPLQVPSWRTLFGSSAKSATFQSRPRRKSTG